MKKALISLTLIFTLNISSLGVFAAEISNEPYVGESYVKLPKGINEPDYAYPVSPTELKESPNSSVLVTDDAGPVISDATGTYIVNNNTYTTNTNTTAAANTAAITPFINTSLDNVSNVGPTIGPLTGAAGLNPDDKEIIGLDHADDEKTVVELTSPLVSPNFNYYGYKVAEGSAKLTDGSWETIEHKEYIRAPFFRLKKEVRDNSGADWYIVYNNASKIGNHSVSDGSRPEELWLKKEDCTLYTSLELNTTSANRLNAVKYALEYLGAGYKYAGNGPDYFDCSGFVKAVFDTVGISIPRSSGEIIKTGKLINISALRPGDIVGRDGHVGIYIGEGTFIHASDEERGVVTESVAAYNGTGSRFTHYVNVYDD